MNINKWLHDNPVNCGRGAPMGSISYCDITRTAPLYLQKVRIDSQGYAPDGTYWGIGKPLWCAFDADGYCMIWVRAAYRDMAKEECRAFNRRVTFKR